MVASTVSLVLVSTHPPATIITLLMIVTVVHEQFVGMEDTLLQLFVTSSYKVMSLVVLSCSSLPPIITGGELFGMRVV